MPKNLGYNNVEFRQGDIEDMPVTANKADVIVSNCVLNLVPNKHKVFSEIYRVLKPGGHFSISDIVLEGESSCKMERSSRILCRLCIRRYSEKRIPGIIEEAGFTNITLQKDKTIIIPDEILANYLSQKKLANIKKAIQE